MASVRTSRAARAAPVGVRAPRESDSSSFWLVGLPATASAVVLNDVLRDDAFRRFFGPVPPATVFVISAAAGSASLRTLSTRGWPATRDRRTSHVCRSTVAGIAFATIPVAVDARWIHFPRDMNVAWPHSVLFYPAVAFVAEVAFHLLPLVLVVTVRGSTAARVGGVAATIAGVAWVEALFHTLDALRGREPRLAAVVAPLLAAVGAYELVLFRRYGFAAMYAFRLGYYLLWHVLWGHARLSPLFREPMPHPGEPT